MFLRLRWFMVGAAAAVAALGYLAKELRKARERLTPRSLANTGMRGVADLLDAAATSVQSDGESQ